MKDKAASLGFSVQLARIVSHFHLDMAALASFSPYKQAQHEFSLLMLDPLLQFSDTCKTIG